MSLERDIEQLTSKIDEQGAPPTAGQAVMAGCLGVALIIKGIFIIAITVVMMWFLWACAGACSEASAAAPRFAPAESTRSFPATAIAQPGSGNALHTLEGL